MAASKFFTYTKSVQHILRGKINFETAVIKAMLLKDNYSPGTASHSALGQISSFQATASATVVNAITLSSVAVTGSGADTIKVTAANISGFSADGSTITTAKYVGLYAQSASDAGVDNLLIGYLNLDSSSASASGGNTTQINVTWPSGGIFKWKTNQ